ncbi:F-box protein At5g49610-like [Durio zibethinus]|uniref:F-box protein At5g49610-like n=1 Tax=Durio zibethinus TaxID=66656 RepID=A0A6P5ZHW0_DURZI|nr:F-box protein At5g49610-like [Durio zibethinus]
MAEFESNGQGMADLESNEQETMEDEGPDAEWDVDDSFYPFSITAKIPKGYTEPPRARLEDVVRNYVLHFLPAKSLYRFRTVSKGWNEWISYPFFAHRQTTYFKDISGLFCQVPGLNPSFISFNQDAYGMPDPSLMFLPEPVNIRSSCNGLLCCQSVGDNVYYICNPVTEEWKVLPKPNLYHGTEAAIVLVFEPQALNFKESYELVCAVTFPDHPVIYFEIYSSRSSSWRLCDTICCELDSLDLHNGGYYMKGVVYWQSSSGGILAFDLKNEQYGLLPLPLSVGQYGSLTVMHGELCYIMPRRQDDGCSIYIHGNMDMSLKSVINLTCDDVGSIFGVCRALPSINDDILILANGRKVIAYHVREHKVELIFTSAGDACTRYLPYVNSLVSVRHPLVGKRA